MQGLYELRILVKIELDKPIKGNDFDLLITANYIMMTNKFRISNFISWISFITQLFGHLTCVSTNSGNLILSPACRGQSKPKQNSTQILISWISTHIHIFHGYSVFADVLFMHQDFRKAKGELMVRQQTGRTLANEIRGNWI